MAMASPRASKTAQEKSRRSLILGENAVRPSAAPISSAIEWKRLLKISSSIGLALSIQHSAFSQKTNYKEHRIEKKISRSDLSLFSFQNFFAQHVQAPPNRFCRASPQPLWNFHDRCPDKTASWAEC